MRFSSRRKVPCHVETTAGAARVPARAQRVSGGPKARGSPEHDLVLREGPAEPAGQGPTPLAFHTQARCRPTGPRSARPSASRRSLAASQEGGAALPPPPDTDAAVLSVSFDRRFDKSGLFQKWRFDRASAKRVLSLNAALPPPRPLPRGCWAASEPMQPTPLLLSAEEGGTCESDSRVVGPSLW